MNQVQRSHSSRSGGQDISPPQHVTAVVVTHNRPEDLRAVVSALLTQSRRLDRIVIVDNASEVPAVTVVPPSTWVECHRSGVNCGGAGGFAWGVAIALSRPTQWVWLMDDDAVPDRDALHSLLSAADRLLSQQVRIASLSPAVHEFGALAPMHRRMFSPSWGWETPLQPAQYARGSLQLIDTTSFVGCLLLAEAIAEAGLPNEQFFLAYDDTEYALRLARGGRRHWLVADSLMDHRRQPTGRLRQSIFGPRHYYNIRNRIYVCRQYANHPHVAGGIAVLYGVALWLRCPKDSVRGSVRLLLAAILDGWHGRLGMLVRKACP